MKIVFPVRIGTVAGLLAIATAAVPLFESTSPVGNLVASCEPTPTESPRKPKPKPSPTPSLTNLT